MATRLACSVCDMQLEGRFEFPELLRLGRDDLDFVLAFVRSSGSLKEMGKHLGQSYPTVRNRLNEIIAKLSAPALDRDAARREILDAIAAGTMSVKEGAKRLEEIDS
ncbi:hypothetical protein AKJ08_3072 [Vulgatibacter incomptus]|uniref:DUF2089 domain-containing protein n=1 Tax=Vulgatibacter incomptus TaxID=1391653 RepID=A0A0K1PGN7_9BACT|nr:hypothetical protein AKJ08_3072 [Vulgatibacter incomptus]